jgi:predicted dehydrogenase
VLNTLTKTEGKVVKTAASLGNATGKYDIDEYGTGLITFDSGASAVVEASWVDPSLHSPIEVFGTEGQIQVVGGKVHYYSQHVEGADGSEVKELPAEAPTRFSVVLRQAER